MSIYYRDITFREIRHICTFVRLANNYYENIRIVHLHNIYNSLQIRVPIT